MAVEMSSKGKKKDGGAGKAAAEEVEPDEEEKELIERELVISYLKSKLGRSVFKALKYCCNTNASNFCYVPQNRYSCCFVLSETRVWEWNASSELSCASACI